MTWISNFNLTTDLEKVMVQWSETELYSSTDPEEGYKNSATQVSQEHSCIHHSEMADVWSMNSSQRDYDQTLINYLG